VESTIYVTLSLTLADCAALAALYYADFAVSLTGRPELAADLERSKTRFSVARVLWEATQPFSNYRPLANER
jgi:glutathione S-transferase